MVEQSPTIPDDLAACQALLRAVLERLKDLERQLDETCATTEELQRSYACLKEEYLALKRLFFGPRRERLTEDPGQQHLFDIDSPPAPPADESAALASGAASAPARKRRKGHGRRIIPDDVPREDVRHEVPEADRVCGCGRTRTLIGEDVTEQVEYVPAKFVVYRHIYPKYACSCCKDGVTAAEPEPAAIPKCLAGPGLLAHVVVSKFAEHLPLYRQQDILARRGIFFSRSTLCGWLDQTGQVFRPLVELMWGAVLESYVIQGDETPVPVLDPTRDSTRKGYLWAKIGDAEHPYTVYHYTDSRSRDGPAAFFKDYRGYLQTDAYSVYESVVANSEGRILAVGCWAHVRRKFFDARLSQPREVHYVLALILRLYDIEDEVRGKSAPERLEARQERSVPILNRLETYLREQQPLALPKSQFGQAIGYALNQWEALLRYAGDGRLEIDNNAPERTLRLCAIGRKNWLFFGSDRGGETAAILYSVLASAKRHRIEPWAYVKALLVALSKPDVDLRSLLPDIWIAAHPEHFLAYRRDEAEAAARWRRDRRADRRAKSAQSVLPPPAEGSMAPAVSMGS
jgi:transposase